MRATSQLIGLPIVSVYEGETIGTTLLPIFQNRSLKGFSVFSDDGNYFLPIRSVYALREDIILVRNLKSFSNEQKLPLPSVIGQKIFCLDGEFLGIVKDLLLTQSFDIMAVVTTLGAVIPADRFSSLRPQTIFLLEEGQKLSRFAPKHKKKLPQAIEAKKELTDTIKVGLQQITVPAAPVHASPSPIPKRFIADTLALLGETIEKDITGMNREIIARRGDKITEELLYKLKQHGQSYVIYELLKKKLFQTEAKT